MCSGVLRCKPISELYFQSLEILRSPKYKGPYVQNKRNLKQSDFNEKWKLFFFSDQRTLDDLTREYAFKSVDGYSCKICWQNRADFSAMRHHMEAKHFPSNVLYSCSLCEKTCRTKHALACHVSKYHKSSIPTE